MKTIHIILLSTVAAAGCRSGGDEPGPPGDSVGTLSEAERERLVFTREEEKLARDVYIALDAYGMPFTNIQDSEQRHFEAVGRLLVTYAIPDPSAGLGIGELASPELQQLHDELVERGTPSRLAALEVGCLIEDLDLRDLDRALAETTHADIATVYGELARGSRNHLRAFYGQVVAAGGTYAPQYIDQATFDAIVTSPNESGRAR